LIVYVESNFVLEIALGQEESASAERVLDFARNRNVELVVPTFALCEPFGTITQRGRDGLRLSRTLADHLRQLLRSEPHRSELQAFESVPETLTRVHGNEMRLLESTLRELLSLARTVELTKEVFEEALEFGSRFGLSPQDAVIYASVLSDLRKRPATPSRSIFVSRNYKDFEDPDIQRQLNRFKCRYVSSYAEAAQAVESGIKT